MSVGMEQHTRTNRPIGIIAIVALALLQSALRFYFALGSTGALGEEMRAQLTTLLENPVADGTLVITVPFLLLGAFGVVTAAGLLAGRRWGLFGTVALSAATIAYDAWAIVAIQPTAVLGIVLPAAFTVYLLARKDRLLALPGVAA